MLVQPSSGASQVTGAIRQAATTDAPRRGVAPVVGQLWAPAKGSTEQVVRTLELFTDQRADARKLFGGT